MLCASVGDKAIKLNLKRWQWHRGMDGVYCVLEYTVYHHNMNREAMYSCEEEQQVHAPCRSAKEGDQMGREEKRASGMGRTW